MKEVKNTKKSNLDLLKLMDDLFLWEWYIIEEDIFFVVFRELSKGEIDLDFQVGVVHSFIWNESFLEPFPVKISQEFGLFMLR